MPSVLVVDDSESIRFLIRTNLELSGFDVDEATDGQECLDLLGLDAPVPDAITLDLEMPRRDGISTVQALRAQPHTRNVPVVMVSTRTQNADVNRGLKAGATAYVTKPFVPARLVEVVRSVLVRAEPGR